MRATNTSRLQLIAADNEPVGAVLTTDSSRYASLTVTNNDAMPSSVAAGETVEGQIIVTGHDHFVIEAEASCWFPWMPLWFKRTDVAPVIDNYGLIGGTGYQAISGSPGGTADITVNNHVGGVILNQVRFNLSAGQDRHDQQ